PVKVRNAANRSSSLRIFPTSHETNSYYPNSRMRPAEYHGYSPYDTPRSEVLSSSSSSHLIETKRGTGTVIIIRGNSGMQANEPPPSPDAKRHSPAGSASVEFETHHDGGRVFEKRIESRIVNKKANPIYANGAVLKQQQLWAEAPKNSSIHFGRNSKNMLDEKQEGRQISSVKESSKQRRFVDASSNSPNSNRTTFKHQDGQSGNHSDDSSTGDRSTEDYNSSSSDASVGKVRIKIGDRGAVIKGSATNASEHERSTRRPPTEARPEPTGASTDGSACNTSSATEEDEEEAVEEDEDDVGNAFKEAEAQAHSSDFVGVEQSEAYEDQESLPLQMQDCATQTEYDEDADLEPMLDLVTGDMIHPITTLSHHSVQHSPRSSENRDSSPEIDWDSPPIHINSRAATVADSSVCEEDDLDSMFGVDQVDFEDAQSVEEETGRFQEDYDGSTIRRKHFLRLAPATQEVDARIGSETEADFLDRDVDFDAGSSPVEHPVEPAVDYDDVDPEEQIPNQEVAQYFDNEAEASLHFGQEDASFDSQDEAEKCGAAESEDENRPKPALDVARNPPPPIPPQPPLVIRKPRAPGLGPPPPPPLSAAAARGPPTAIIKDTAEKDTDSPQPADRCPRTERDAAADERPGRLAQVSTHCYHFS
ncbi:unnamed protein product, partial [Notodromas monacha]